MVRPWNSVRFNLVLVLRGQPQSQTWICVLDLGLDLGLTILRFLDMMTILVVWYSNLITIGLMLLSDGDIAIKIKMKFSFHKKVKFA